MDSRFAANHDFVLPVAHLALSLAKPGRERVARTAERPVATPQTARQKLEALVRAAALLRG